LEGYKWRLLVLWLLATGALVAALYALMSVVWHAWADVGGSWSFYVLLGYRWSLVLFCLFATLAIVCIVVLARHYKRLPKLADTAIVAVVGLVIVTVGPFYLLTETPETINAPRCRTATYGPLEVADCNAAGDGPLIVHTRFPRRFVVDCGFWVIVRNEHFCRMIIDLQGARALERRKASAPNRTVERDARKSGARPSP
jgi:hypothetical protein